MRRRAFIAGVSACAAVPVPTSAATESEPEMRIIRRGGINLATQAFGDPSGVPLLLIMGATASMLGWPDALCEALARSGHYVVRYDHRDTGQSTAVPLGSAAYDVEDMAGDALAVMDGYSLASAHLMGMSLGGFIAQMLAVSHPDQVRSLVLIASEPLGWDGADLPHIDPALLDHFAALPALDWSDRAAVAAFLLEIDRISAGPRAIFDETAARGRIAEVLSRMQSPASMFNHAARTTRGDWTGAFRTIRQPTLVIHGEMDPVLPLANGQALADGIPGATLAVLKDVGHGLPVAELDRIADLVAVHVRDAGD